MIRGNGLQVYENLGSFSDSDLANLLWSSAALGHRNLALLDHLLASKQEDLRRCSPDSLHLVIWSLEKLGYVPSRAWVQAFLDALQPTLFQLTPAQMVDIVWALARLGELVVQEGRVIFCVCCFWVLIPVQVHRTSRNTAYAEHLAVLWLIQQYQFAVTSLSGLLINGYKGICQDTRLPELLVNHVVLNSSMYGRLLGSGWVQSAAVKGQDS